MEITKKITKDKNYKRPKTTLQDTLQNNESVKEKLIGYVELSSVDEISYLPQNTPMRYITKKNGEYLFRLGGLLVINKPEYIVLKSINNLTWCVQKKDTIFYRALSKDEKATAILEEHENLIDEQQEEIKYLKEKLKENNIHH